jgi:polysaccharide biosynthesis transport protein
MNAMPSLTIEVPEHQPRFIAVSRLLALCHRSLLLLRRNWWLVLLPPVAGAGLAYAWHLHSPPRFESIAKLWITSELNVTDARFGSEDLINFIGTQAELLRSDTVRQKALELMVQREGRAPLIDPKDLKFVVRDSVRNSVMELELVSPDASVSQTYLQALIDAFFAFKQQSLHASSSRTLISVGSQVAEVEREFKESQDALHSFQASNNIVAMQEQGASVGAYLARLNRQLSSLRTEYRLLELLTPAQVTGMVSSSSTSDDPVPGQAASRDLAATLAGPQADAFRAEQQLGLLRAKQTEWSEYMRPTHPKMLKLLEEISIQERLLAVYRDQSRSQLADRREALRLQIQNLEAAYTEWEAKVLDSNQKLALAERLQQTVQQKQRLFDRLVGVIQTVDVNQYAGVERVTVLEPASPALPLRYSLGLLLALGICAGLVIGVLGVYFVGLFDDRFTSVSEIYQHLDCGVAAEVPQVQFRGSQNKALLLPSPDDRPLFEEAFRTLRSSLLFGLNGQAPPKTILVTSAVPEEGKSTVAANLALTLAAGGLRVLVVDADLRQSRLHQLFGTASYPGLAEVLSQGVSYQDCFQTTAFSGLTLMAAGHTSTNPSDLFLSPAINLFIEAVSSQFDYVVVDSPPVLAADDTTTLCSKFGGVLAVVRADFTPATRVRRALALLTARKANILGVVYNRARASLADGAPYQYAKYYRAYRQGPPALSSLPAATPLTGASR